MAGPFEIKRRIGPLAYELTLPINPWTMKSHPVVSAIYLEQANANDTFNRVIPPPSPMFQTSLNVFRTKDDRV